jgi:hypothetical protein
MSSGYVDWKTLLKDVIADLDLDSEKEHDLVSVAQYYVNKSGSNKNALTRTILHNFGVAKSPTKGHEILASIPIHTFWTTNYDRLIEKSLEDAKKVPDVKHIIEHLSITWPNRDAVIYKMHGDVGDPTNAVICKDDYERYPFKMGQFASLLKGDLMQKTFVFLGFSFTDPNIDFILSRVRTVLEKNQREHYCIQKKITRRPKEKTKEFEYRQLKQDYFIRDLKRKNIQTQGNRIKKEEVRAKSAKHAKDSERGFTQPVDQPINVSFEQISSEMDEQPEFELGKPQIGQYLLTMDTGGRLNRF